MSSTQRLLATLLRPKAYEVTRLQDILSGGFDAKAAAANGTNGGAVESTSAKNDKEQEQLDEVLLKQQAPQVRNMACAALLLSPLSYPLPSH